MPWVRKDPLPPVPENSGALVRAPEATTIAELRAVPVGENVAVPRAPASGDLGVDPGTPVAVVAEGFLKNRTVRVAIALIGAAFSLFLGYVADQVVATQFFAGDIPWYFDVLIVLGVGAAGICLVVFWKTPVLARVRKAIGAGLAAFFGYVGYTIIANNGLDGVDAHKTFHTALNFGIVAAVGGILLISKVFDNNPVTGAPWSKKS